MPRQDLFRPSSAILADLKRNGCLAGLVCEECGNSSEIRLQKVEARVAAYVSGQVLNILSSSQSSDVITLAWSTRNLLEVAVLYHWISTIAQPLDDLDSWLAADELHILDALMALNKKNDPGYTPDSDFVNRRALIKARIKPGKGSDSKFLSIKKLAEDPIVNRKVEYDAKFKLLSKLTHCSPYSLFETRADSWSAPVQLLAGWAAKYSLELVCRIGLRAQSKWVDPYEAESILKRVSTP